MDQRLGIRHTKKLAHRRYLNHDNVRPGVTYSQREKEYTQLRLDQARDSVFEKKFQDALVNNEAKEVGFYSGNPWPKSTQVTNPLERIANEMIRDSIKRGEFSNLPGQGRPIESGWDNPVLSTIEQKVNVMLGNSGFAPDWIVLDKEIRVSIEELKEQVLVAWNQYGPHPMSYSHAVKWEQNMCEFEKELKEINKKIRDRNLKGPLTGQRVALRLNNLVTQTISSVVPIPKPAKPEKPATQDSGSLIELGGIVIAICAIVGLFRL